MDGVDQPPVSGVDTLALTDADSAVEFHRFGDGGVPAIAYSVADASGDGTTLEVTNSLTSTRTTGPETSRSS
ncbi:hypothetical protein [Natronobacterium gregoryi]|uniref:Uncharacterized protein n=2 Tax=Natronobacterium gregoryi TaxID=44930 RepID=L0AML4_NATGS|nr:hypothetical protein [Natronobacterium gregoryi]AFZ74310.1 hypothetical protein Natgr_3180 [Natronobacterium gregoryi SP2]ELY63540.1 hypothetical protein C490_16019 [Natronobacterium gregoryi SP2]PLK22181.1 hypothetical protein CYV19_00455 [Natronobacterium gregoryi SP2]SFI53465.1 hypothetical protein SAMN05443661_101199 [Natronobacterium gregoryi]